MTGEGTVSGVYSEYDPLAPWYRRWSKADSAAGQSLDFYKEICKGVDVVIELGVGDGRIAIEVAKRGTRVVGVDSSAQMLTLCHNRALNEGVSDRVVLIHNDVRKFMSIPVPLVILPFRTIGHLTRADERLDLAINVRRHLIDGGRFVFDHYVFNPRWAAQNDGVPQLMCSWDAGDGSMLSIVDTYRYAYLEHKINCSIAIERTSDDGQLLERAAYPLSFSWIEPNEVYEMANRAGFIVEKVYGDFNGGPFQLDSDEQVWILRKDGRKDPA